MTTSPPAPRSKRLLVLWSLALGVLVAVGCVPKVTPAEYYEAMRCSLDSVEETTSGKWSILKRLPMPDEPKRIAANTSHLETWARENPAAAQAARDYVQGIEAGKRIGISGDQLGGSVPEGKSKAWLEGAEWGHKMGFYQHVMFSGDNDLRDRARREYTTALSEKMKRKAVRRLMRKLDEGLEEKAEK